MTSMCPYNINNGLNNILFKTHILDPTSTHLSSDRQYYFNLCIVIRLILCALLFSLILIDSDELQTVITVFLLLLSVGTIYHLGMKASPLCQWWSNELEIVLALIAVIVCGYCLYKKKQSSQFVAMIFLVSIMLGFIQSKIRKPFLMVQQF
jgi:hypothetical protein